jgi:subtilase family serine protease
MLTQHVPAPPSSRSGRLRWPAIAMAPVLTAALCLGSTGAYAGGSDPSDITYIANPPHKLAISATGPVAFPTPSQCVAMFGLACYTPQEIHTAYDIPTRLTGAGQTIVIVDAYGSPTVRQDLHIFDQAFGLPDPTLNIITPEGQPAYNPHQHHDETSWAGETSLDVQWSHAIAPGATIDLVIAANNGGNALNVAERYVVDHHLGNVMSMSFGAPEADIHGQGNNLQLQSARTTSDVAYNASVYTAVLAYLGFLGGSSNGFYFFGGTSEGAPQWAAITALADQAAGHALGFLNPALYAIGANHTEYAADFHDVTAGDNAFFSPGFAAGPGYDLPTGLGTPDVAHLIGTLTGT